MRLTQPAEIQITYKDTKINLSFDKADVQEVVNFFSKLKADTEYDIEAKLRARRSLNANSYYWSLIQKIARVNGISQYECHNLMLADYGVDLRDEDGNFRPVLMKDTEDYLKNKTFHLRATSHTETRNGKEYRWFILMKPSHLMDKTEFSRLLSGCITEAQALDIDTKSHAEIERLVEKWNPKAE